MGGQIKKQTGWPLKNAFLPQHPSSYQLERRDDLTNYEPARLGDLRCTKRGRERIDGEIPKPQVRKNTMESLRMKMDLQLEMKLNFKIHKFALLKRLSLPNR